MQTTLGHKLLCTALLVSCAPGSHTADDTSRPAETADTASDCTLPRLDINNGAVSYSNNSRLGSHIAVLSAEDILTSDYGSGEGMTTFESREPAGAGAALLRPAGRDPGIVFRGRTENTFLKQLLGQRAFPLGDINGDGEDDLVITVIDAPQQVEGLAYSGAILGPFADSTTYTAPSEVGTIVNDVAWHFAKCDINQDGLNDLCSTRGFALSPPPFEQSSTFANPSANDLISSANLDGTQGFFIYRESSSTLHFVPDAMLPPDGKTLEELATASFPTTTKLLALTSADILPEPGHELVATVNDGGSLGVQIWSIAPGLPLLISHTTCAAASDQGALAIGNLNDDTLPDLAFASNGQVALLQGPPSSSDRPIWLTVADRPEVPDLPFGYSLAVSDDNATLYVGFPAYYHVPELDPNSSPKRGSIYAIARPLAP